MGEEDIKYHLDKVGSYLRKLESYVKESDGLKVSLPSDELKELRKFVSQLHNYTLRADNILEKVDPIEEALVQFRTDLPNLLARQAGHWVAYHRREFIDTALNKTELYEKCISRGYKRGEFLVRCIEPEIERIEMSPDRVIP